MSWWTDFTHPINQILNSTGFKAAFPVQALGQEAVKQGTALVGFNHGKGLQPTDQYATGAGIGSALGGGSALFGGSGAGGMTPYIPTSAPNMGAAGSTLGAGGASSPLSLGGYGSTSGMGLSQGAGSSAATPSMISKVLQMQRMAGGQQQPAQAPQQDVMTRLYQMFPSLRPGSRLGSGMKMGGM